MDAMGRAASAAVLALYLVALATGLACPCVSEAAAPSSTHGCCEVPMLRAAAVSCCSAQTSQPRPASVEPAGFVPDLGPVAAAIPSPVAATRPRRVAPSLADVASRPPVLRI